MVPKKSDHALFGHLIIRHFLFTIALKGSAEKQVRNQTGLKLVFKVKIFGLYYLERHSNNNTEPVVSKSEYSEGPESMC